jgi:competence protein ComEA
VRAQAIVDHRKANGGFASVGGVLAVDGIGEATLEANRDRMVVGSE